MQTVRRKTADKALEDILVTAVDQHQEFVWDRYEKMQPQCGFGELGLSCRACLQGPCRIDPFGHKAKAGICGRTEDVMAAARLLELAGLGLGAKLVTFRGLLAAMPGNGLAEIGRFLSDPGTTASGWLGADLAVKLGEAGLLGTDPLGLVAEINADMAGPGYRDADWLARQVLRAGLAAVLADMGIQICRETLYSASIKVEGDTGIRALSLKTGNILALGELPAEYLGELLAAAGPELAVYGVYCPDPRVMPLVPTLAGELPALTGRISVVVHAGYADATLSAAFRERGIPIFPAAGAEPRRVLKAARERAQAAASIFDPRTPRAVLAFGREAALAAATAAKERRFCLVAGEPGVRSTAGAAIQECLLGLEKLGVTAYAVGEAATAGATLGIDAAAMGSHADQAGAIALYLLEKGLPPLVAFPELARAETLASALGCAAAGMTVAIEEPLPFLKTGDLDQRLARAMPAGGRLIGGPQGVKAVAALVSREV